MIKVGINGFGRIGRIAFRIWLLKHTGDMEITAINTSGSMDAHGWAHLVNYDTMYRKFEKNVGGEEVNKAKEVTTALEEGKNINPILKSKEGKFRYWPSATPQKFPGRIMESKSSLNQPASSQPKRRPKNTRWAEPKE